MTKEEFIEQLIEARKESADIAMSCVCEKVSCQACPYFGSKYCTSDIIDDLLDYIIELEKHKETNLEHYVAYYNNYDQCIYMDTVKLMNEAHRRLNNFGEAIEWLLEPYKPPKPKYKLSKFEYDFLECLKGQKTDLRIYYIFKSMREKGYFKDISKDTKIKDILDNAEVVEE